MDLVLAFPSLLAVARALRPPLPALGRLLRLAGPAQLRAGDLARWLAAHGGIDVGDDVPLAALRRQATAADAGSYWWASADPVTLVAGRDDARIERVVADLRPEEAAAIAARLGAHFAGDGLVFAVTASGSFVVRSDVRHRIATTPATRLVGAPLRGHLPRGPDAARWRRWSEEIAMLLHADPINAAREDRDLPPVNALWFSGTGPLPPAPPAVAGRVIATTDADLLALALHAGIRRADAAAGAAAALAAAAPAAELIVVASGTAWAAIDAAFAAPGWDALARGRVGTVTVVADGGERVAAWRLTRPGVLARLGAAWRGRDAAAAIAAVADEN